MEIVIKMEEWKIKEFKADNIVERKIAGSFKVMAGNTEVATQSFNDQYGSKKMAFPAQLMVDAEALTAKIEAEITKQFGGE